MSTSLDHSIKVFKIDEKNTLKLEETINQNSNVVAMKIHPIGTYFGICNSEGWEIMDFQGNVAFSGPGGI